MTILSGGAYQAGAIRLADVRVPAPGTGGTLRTHQITAPPTDVDRLSSWLQLVPCPLGLDRYVLRARIAYQDSIDVPTRSGKGAEANARATSFLLSWGDERIHYWRMLIPPDFPFLDSVDTNTVVAQVHEVGTNSPAGQPPNFYVQISRRILNFRQSNDTYPSTRTIYSMPIVAGQELDFSLRCRWRDGIHSVPWAAGYLQLMVNGSVVWEDTQTANCWVDAADATQPFPVAGVYKPNSPSEPTWVSGTTWMYHVGAASGDASETHASLAAFVASQL